MCKYKLTIITVVLVILFVRWAAGIPQDEIPQQMVSSILDRNWKTIAAGCDAKKSQTTSPVCRAIWGHACLATNRNNEAVFLFLSIGSKVDLKKWDQWTAEFLAEHPENCVAHYFRGDAFARQGEGDKAIEAYSSSLDKKSDFVLPMIGMGIIYAKRGSRDEADKMLAQPPRFGRSRFIQLTPTHNYGVMERLARLALRDYEDEAIPVAHIQIAQLDQRTSKPNHQFVRTCG